MNPSSVRSTAPIFLLDVSMLGGRWRLATQAVSITSGLSDPDRTFHAGLTVPSVTQAIGSLGSASPTEPTATFEGIYLDGALDLMADGGALIIGRGEFSAILAGDVWERRVVLASGRVTGVRVARNDLVSFVLGETLGEDIGTLIPPTAVIDDESWPNAPDGSDGVVYPIVIGTPGVYTDTSGTTKYTAATPAPMVDDTGGAEVLLLSLGRVSASTVRIRNAEDATGEDFNVTITTDGRGQTVSVVSLAGAATLTVDPEAEYHARWSGGGGLIGRSGSYMSGAGEVLLWALSHSTIPVDLARFEAVRGELDRYKVSGYIDDNGFSPVEWVADNLLKLLPISLGCLGGIYPIMQRWGQRIEQSELILDVDAVPGELEVDDSALEIDGSPVSTFSLRYAWSIFHQAPKRTRTVSGDPAYLAQDAAAVQGHALLSVASDMARALTGTTQTTVETIETRWVYDDVTAGLILNSYSALRAVPNVNITLRCSWYWLARLRLGQIVSFSASELRITRRVCQVDSIEYGFTSGRVRLRVVADPERNRHNRS